MTRPEMKKVDKVIDITIARNRNELLQLKNEENIRINHERFSIPDMIYVCYRNPRLKRIFIPEHIYARRFAKTEELMMLINIRGIELVVKNITYYHNEPNH